MWDKTFILVLILCVFAGLSAYDRALAKRGEVGPVSRLIDFTGLADFSKSNLGGMTNVKTHSNYCSADSLARLHQKIADVESQRARLITQRREILKQMGQVNDQVLDNASAYVTAIQKEQTAVKEQLPEFLQFQQSVQKAKTPSLTVNSQLGPNSGQNGKVDEGFALPETLANDQQKVSALAAAAVEKVVDEARAVVIKECGPKEIRACLESSPEIRQKFLTTYLTALAQEPDFSTPELALAVQSLSREYLTLDQNQEATETQLNQSSANVANQLQQLCLELDAKTQENLAELGALYKTLWEEAAALEDNLDFNTERVKEVQAAVDEKILAVMNRLKSSPLADSKRLADNFAALLDKRTTLFNDYLRNENKTRLGQERFWQEEKEMLALQERQASAQATQRQLWTQKNQALNSSTREVKTRTPLNAPASRQYSTTSSQVTRPQISTPARDQNRPTEAWEKLQRLRDQATDQGFYR